MPANTELRDYADSAFGQHMENYAAIDLICLATSDGFPIVSRSLDRIHFELDTLAAASSTLHSVSNAVSKQILLKPFRVAFIESEKGNVAFVSLQLQQGEFVLTMSADESMNIGQLRVMISRLAEQISNNFH
ncbi:hypothetical protein [Pseudomaricurvus sp. HS19]|uniref:roadblock/LC7 domain-containing protein n=1 Tax=Pseudomaricurvus sp. HS19 TaxID=2692626 RepID=UPI00136C0552|nr:hypothetical protein [Pseudomaricurvus sp. HS19]MYM63343.1 hypothetical protein [Pseudomaricurvus sp. HS19]